jgi:hypothetical protein
LAPLTVWTTRFPKRCSRAFSPCRLATRFPVFRLSLCVPLQTKSLASTRQRAADQTSEHAHAETQYCPCRLSALLTAHTPQARPAQRPLQQPAAPAPPRFLQAPRTLLCLHALAGNNTRRRFFRFLTRVQSSPLFPARLLLPIFISATLCAQLHATTLHAHGLRSPPSSRILSRLHRKNLPPTPARTAHRRTFFPLFSLPTPP